VTDAELKQFYEKLYFHEIDSRDKVQGRLQLSLTLLLAVSGAVVFLFQNFDYQTGVWTALRWTFAFFFCMGTILLVVGMVFFVKAFYNNAYYFLPDSKQTAEYKKLLETTYEEFDEREKLVSEALDQYITGYYIEYAAFNTQTNDRRSAYVHLCNGAIVGAAVLFIAAFLAFYFGDLDKSKIKPAAEVFVTKPVDVRVMDNRK
jgi:hypothetical protein